MAPLEDDEWFRPRLENKLAAAVPDKLWNHTTYATKLLSSYRELQETQAALEAKRKEFDSKMASIEDRRWELTMQEQQLQRELRKYDQYIYENDRKRYRALKKTTTVRVQMSLKKRELVMCKQDHARVKNELALRRKKLTRLQVYTGFLNSVIESAPEFDEIHEVLARYETLTFTLQELKEKEAQNQARIDALKYENGEYLKDKSSEVMELNQRIVSMQTRLDKAEQSARILDSDFHHIKTTAAKQTLELGKMKMAINTMYSRILETQTSRKYQEFKDDPFEQLSKIENYIIDLRDIVSDRQNFMTSSDYTFRE